MAAVPAPVPSKPAITQPAPVLTDQPIAALTAVPVGPPPVLAKSPSSVAGAATGWRSKVDDYLGTAWEPVSLAAALVIGAGFLFWRLGKRARHGERELILAEGLQEEPAFPAEELPLLSFINASRAESVDAPDHEAARPRRQFATLREALAAMDADMTGPKVPQRKQVDA